MPSPTSMTESSGLDFLGRQIGLSRKSKMRSSISIRHLALMTTRCQSRDLVTPLSRAHLLQMTVFLFSFFTIITLPITILFTTTQKGKSRETSTVTRWRAQLKISHIRVSTTMRMTSSILSTDKAKLSPSAVKMPSMSV